MNSIEINKCAKIINFMLEKAQDEKIVVIDDDEKVKINYKNVAIVFKFFDSRVKNKSGYVTFILYNKETKASEIYCELTTPDFYDILSTYNSLKTFWQIMIQKQRQTPIDKILTALNID